jgi:hypothetical protein
MQGGPLTEAELAPNPATEEFVFQQTMLRIKDPKL